MVLVSRQYLCSGAPRGAYRVLAPNVSVRCAGAMRRHAARRNTVTLSSMLLHTYHLRAWLRGFTVLPRVTGGLGDVRGPFDAEYASRRLPNMRQWLRGNTYQHSNK